MTRGSYTWLLQRNFRSPRPGDPPEPLRDDPSWPRWWLECDLRDIFGDATDDQMYAVELLLERAGLSEEMKAEAYAVLGNTIGMQQVRQRVGEPIHTDPDQQLERFRETFDAFYEWCFFDWEWASEDLLEATRRVLDLIDRDRRAVRPLPADRHALPRQIGIHDGGSAQPPKPEVRWGLDALRTVGIGRDDGRQLLAIIGIIT